MEFGIVAVTLSKASIFVRCELFIEVYFGMREQQKSQRGLRLIKHTHE
jgi:hypothetical protein